MDKHAGKVRSSLRGTAGEGVALKVLERDYGPGIYSRFCLGLVV